MIKVIINIIDYIRRETWWRSRYTRVNCIYEEHRDKLLCDLCDAGCAPPKHRCDIQQDRFCPCKKGQYLLIKTKHKS